MYRINCFFSALTFSFLFFTASQISAQCISGDCDNGHGVFRSPNGDRYEGLFRDGKREGRGIINYANGDRYEGDFKAGKRQGFGTLAHLSGKAEGGAWENDKLVAADPNIRRVRECLTGDCQNGKGRSRDLKGRIYDGHFKHGLYDGFGTLYANDGRYEGYFHKGVQHGKGTYYHKSGHTDIGEWKQGRYENASMRTWAVVVGVADYPHFPKLTYTLNDAREVYKFFRSTQGGAIPTERIRLLLDEQATRQSILDTLNAVFQRAGENDLILFYFAGHGEEGSFLPYDYNEKTDENRLFHSEVLNEFKDSPAKFKLCIADACHSGSFKDAIDGSVATAKPKDRTTREEIKNYYSSFENVRGGLAFIASSAAEEASLEASKLGQGVFSYFFRLGLSGKADTDENGIITITELYSYIHDHVQIYTYEYQKPLIFGDYDKAMPVGTVHKK